MMIPRRYIDELGPLFTLTDTAALALHAEASGAVMRSELRERVVYRKSRFFGSAWARYDWALPPAFKLVPPPEGAAVLRVRARNPLPSTDAACRLSGGRSGQVKEAFQLKTSRPTR